MIFDKVVALITRQLPIPASKISMDSRLFEDLGADSANVMMLVMDLEEEFNLTVEDDALTTIRTVGDVVKYIEERVG
ncbi:MAG: acyl carrier protein [Clostridiales bacterium]|nr:acyl carrier protein [Clostridiales bacterium]